MEKTLKLTPFRLIKGQLGYEQLPKRQAGVAPEPVGYEGRAEQQGEGLRQGHARIAHPMKE